jgi:hypothetical protein
VPALEAHQLAQGAHRNDASFRDPRIEAASNLRLKAPQPFRLIFAINQYRGSSRGKHRKIDDLLLGRKSQKGCHVAAFFCGFIHAQEPVPATSSWHGSFFFD